MIRRRLVIAVVVTITAVLAIAGVVIIRILEVRLVATIDDQLDEVTSDPGHLAEIDLHPADSRFDLGRLALVRVGADGQLLVAIPSGPSDDPDPLPDVAGLAAPAGPLIIDPLEQNGPRYRAMAVELPDGGMVVVAFSLAEVDATLSDTTRILVPVGVGAFVTAAVIVWLTIRRGLRPIDDMIATAEGIADGDLTARTSVSNPDSEVGLLSTALNTMLDRIGQAMAVKAESEARMRRFVADASHELRTPLTSIRGYAELYRQGASSSDQVALGMARIEREGHHMSRLVEDLLLLARLDQARPVAAEPVDLARVVQEVAADVHSSEPQRHIVLHLPDRPATVSGDREGLRQILDNLLANIHQHTGPDTTATIEVGVTDTAATLTVSDDGPGMTPDEAVHAFERFWQAEPDPTHPRHGAGLGLAIVAELVAAHGGTIALDTAPGAGTSFTISLPTASDLTSEQVSGP